MNYYDNTQNKIRRRKVTPNNTYRTAISSDIPNTRYGNTIEKQNQVKINRSNSDDRTRRNDDLEVEQEIYYRKRAKKRKKNLKIIKKASALLLTLMVIATICASLLIAVCIKGTPKLTKETIYNSYVTNNVVPVNEIPDDLKNAIIATEDRRFYKHNGVDYKSLMRSFFNNLLSDTVQGGSTIDMQVSKNLLTSDDRTIKRKIRDMYNALQMNKIMTKDEILSAYLNNIYFGKSSYGVQNAARTYFNKDVKDLNLAECAMIAGITNNPAKFSQHDEAKRRQEVVLKNMYEQGYITEEQYNDAISDSTPFKSEIY